MNFSEIWIKIQTFHSPKMHLKMASGEWHPFCLSLNVLNISFTLTKIIHQNIHMIPIPITCCSLLRSSRLRYVMTSMVSFSVWCMAEWRASFSCTKRRAFSLKCNFDCYWIVHKKNKYVFAVCMIFKSWYACVIQSKKFQSILKEGIHANDTDIVINILVNL